MRCEEAQAILVPPDDPRITYSDVARALEHADACPRCRTWVDADHETARLIRERAPRTATPQAVRHRIYAALARER